MIDFPLFAHLMMWGFVAMVIIFNVFKWGHDKEHGKRK